MMIKSTRDVQLLRYTSSSDSGSELGSAAKSGPLSAGRVGYATFFLCSAPVTRTEPPPPPATGQESRLDVEVCVVFVILEDQRAARICAEEPMRAKVVESAHAKALRTARNGIRVCLAKRKKW